MKDSDKVTLTVAQLKKLVRESKSRKRFVKEAQSRAVKLLDDAISYNIMMQSEDEEHGDWSEKRYIDWEYEDVWTSVEYQCRVQHLDFDEIKAELLDELGEKGIYEFIRKKVVESGYWRDKKFSKIKSIIEILGKALEEANSELTRLEKNEDVVPELIADVDKVLTKLNNGLDWLQDRYQ